MTPCDWVMLKLTVITMSEPGRSARVDENLRAGRVRGRRARAGSLDVAAGEFLALMGPSGSGKTHAAEPASPASTGRRRADSRSLGTDVSRCSAARPGAPGAARHVGYIFQPFNLIPVLTAYENVELPLLLHAAVASASGASTCATALELGRPGRPRRPLPAPALRRAGAARRHRPGDRHRPDAHRRRRADRRPRRRDGRRGARRCSGGSTRSSARRS